MKTENKVLERIKETDPITHRELLELQRSRPGLFSRIITAAVWSLIGGGVGHIFAGEPELGALAGGLLGTMKKYREGKRIDKQITETILRSQGTQAQSYQHVRPALTAENHVPYSYRHLKRNRNPFDGSRI